MVKFVGPLAVSALRSSYFFLGPEEGKERGQLSGRKRWEEVDLLWRNFESLVASDEEWSSFSDYLLDHTLNVVSRIKEIYFVLRHLR